MNVTIEESTTAWPMAHEWLAEAGLGFIANNGSAANFRFTAGAELLARCEDYPGRWAARVPFAAQVKYGQEGTYTVLRPRRVPDQKG